MLLPSIFAENLLDDWMGFDFPDVDKTLYGKRSQNLMKTDIRETDKSYELLVDLPGFKKDEVNVKLENGYLTVRTNKGLEKEDKKNGKYIRRERYTGTMERSFFVGDHVTQEDIHAKFEDGILQLDVTKEDPKKVEESKYIAIEG